MQAIDRRKQSWKTKYVWMVLLLLLAIVGTRLAVRADSSDLVRVTCDSAQDGAPSVMRDANGKLHAVYHSLRSGNWDLWYTSSSDEGATWAAPVALTSHSSGDQFPTIIQDYTGKLWVFWSSERSGSWDLWFTNSTTGGASWYAPEQFTTDDLWDYAPSALQASNGKLWVTWYSYRSGNWDLWYRTSSNYGQTWSSPTQLTTDLNWDHSPEMIEPSPGTMWVFWHSDRSGNRDIWGSWTSNDGGTWSSPTQLSDSPESDSHPTAAMLSGTMYLFWHSASDPYGNLVYRSSSNNGVSWSNTWRYTSFGGVDEDPDAVAMNGKIGVLWGSDRAVTDDLWWAVLGYRDDTNPPPHYESSEHEPYQVTEDDPITVRVTARDDDLGLGYVSSVQLVWRLNGTLQTEIPMLDDGAHTFATTLPAQAAQSTILCQFRITDDSGNHILAPHNAMQVNVQGSFTKQNNILLVLDRGPQQTAWFSPYFEAALADAGYGYDRWDCYERQEIPSNILMQYALEDHLVIWAIPESGYLAASTTQDNIADMLDWGGNLLLVGQDVGFNLRDSTFLSNYAHAALVQDDVGLYALSGTSGDLLDGLYLPISSAYYMGEYDGEDNQAWPSELDPIAPAVAIAHYDIQAESAPPAMDYVSREMLEAKPSKRTNQSPMSRQVGTARTGDGWADSMLTAVQSSGAGALRVDMGAYRVVTLSFGLEALPSDALRAQVMARLVPWLTGQEAAPTATPGPTATATPTQDAAVTPTTTQTPKYTATATVTPSPTATASPTVTPIPTEAHAQMVLKQGQNGYTGTTDTYLHSWEPTSNFGDGETIEVDYDDVAIGLIRFDLGTVPRPISVISVKLRLYADSRDTSTLLVVQAHPVLREWDEAGASWAIAASGQDWGLVGCNDTDSDRVATSAHNTLIINSGQWYEFDLTAESEEWLSNPDTNLGVALLSYSKDYCHVRFASSEHSNISLHPELVITFDSLDLPISLSRDLTAGWHLLSYPCQLSSDAVPDVLASLDGNYDLVQGYFPEDLTNPWHSYDPAAPPAANTLSNLPLGSAFWVHMTGPATWLVEGTALYGTQVSLAAGANLVGWPIPDAEPLPDALSSIAGDYELVWAYASEQNPATWQHFGPVAGEWANTLTMMAPGHGYWVIAKQACIVTFN